MIYCGRIKIVGKGLYINPSHGFTVSFAHVYIDSFILESVPQLTTWNCLIPSKFNILFWRLNLNKVPTRLNMDRCDIDVGSMLCPIYNADVKMVNHLFFLLQDDNEFMESCC